jgi:hypothetical protein
MGLIRLNEGCNKKKSRIHTPSNVQIGEHIFASYIS